MAFGVYKNEEPEVLLRDISKLDSYKNIFKLIKLSMCVPLTSVEPERIFSHVNLIITKIRNSIGVDTVNQLLFIIRSS